MPLARGQFWSPLLLGTMKRRLPRTVGVGLGFSRAVADKPGAVAGGVRGRQT